MAEVEIPSYFLCPISLQLMRDPVTLPTGITYDRDSIERWLFSDPQNPHHTCPVTKQPLPVDSIELTTPNHTLRRLIQSWCIANSSAGVDRIPTPRSPLTRTQLSALLLELETSTSSSIRLLSLRKLKSIASNSASNRLTVASSDAVDFLASVVERSPEEEDARVCDEALTILCSLHLSETRLQTLITSHPGFLDALFAVLPRSSYHSRSQAGIFLRSVIPVASPARLSKVGEAQLRDLVEAVSDRVSTKAALEALILLCSWGRNRVKEVNAGAVALLVDLLLEETEKRMCELALVALDKLCSCAEGRAELVGNAAGIAVVAKKILRVSAVASERAVRILEKVARTAANQTGAVLQEMMQVGAVSKLCLLLQVKCGEKEKKRATEVLRLHARVWMNSPCLSPQFLSLYPSP
ncbi:hypothetical protein HPP92_002826 [Vanilla planifolia]|uniref:U-box domain-containing protein n=1 Tax=Vanilla planifolia TaxID=51239 RepID=A0A835S714_VANPL|nr:hypothetical protein HPP92_002826 [Vanilla planifolia]